MIEGRNTEREENTTKHLGQIPADIMEDMEIEFFLAILIIY